LLVLLLRQLLPRHDTLPGFRVDKVTLT
jgi:hypothetical protein